MKFFCSAFLFLLVYGLANIQKGAKIMPRNLFEHEMSDLKGSLVDLGHLIDTIIADKMCIRDRPSDLHCADPYPPSAPYLLDRC